MDEKISDNRSGDQLTDNGNRVTVVPVSKTDRPGKAGPLEKELTKFQKLLAEIAALETQSQQQKVLDEEYHRLYSAKVQPVLVDVAKAQLVFVEQIESVFNAGKFARNFEARFVDFVIPILEDASIYLADATAKLHNYRVWQTSLLKKETGVTETRSNNESGENNQDAHTSTFRNEYKSNNNDNMEDFAGKSISALYKELAKMIHPDLEQDEDKREEKEQMMKSLVDAKNDEDLYAMLLMRKQAMLLNNTAATTSNVFSLQDLKSYNTLLKQKLDALRRSIDKHFFSGGGSHDNFFAKSKKQLSPAKRVKEDVRNLRALQESLLHNARVISSSSQLKELLDL